MTFFQSENNIKAFYDMEFDIIFNYLKKTITNLITYLGVYDTLNLDALLAEMLGIENWRP